MKKFFNLANGVMLVFLLASMTANIMQGELTYKFITMYTENQATVLKVRARILAHDSAEDRREDAILKNQMELIEQNAILTIRLDKLESELDLFNNKKK